MINNATQNATLQNSEPIAAQCNPENSATGNATQTATDALGSLPVVAYETLWPAGHKTVGEYKPKIGYTTIKALADHAQATAEIEKLRLEKSGAEMLVEVWKGRAQDFSAKLQGVEGLVTLLKRYRNETPLGHQPYMIAHEADAALAAYEEVK